MSPLILFRVSKIKSPVSFLARNQRNISHDNIQILFLTIDYIEIHKAQVNPPILVNQNKGSWPHNGERAHGDLNPYPTLCETLTKSSPTIG